MNTNEIKALREANTIEAVVLMVDCRNFEHGAKEQALHIQYHLLLQYSDRVSKGIPEAEALNRVKASVVCANGGTVQQQSEFWRAADAAMNVPKAEKVHAVYYTAAWDELLCSESCYALAVDAAVTLGGIEIANSNDGNGTKSFAPTVTYEFDDFSSVYVTYGGVYVIEPNEPY